MKSAAANSPHNSIHKFDPELALAIVEIAKVKGNVAVHASLLHAYFTYRQGQQSGVKGVRASHCMLRKAHPYMSTNKIRAALAVLTSNGLLAVQSAQGRVRRYTPEKISPCRHYHSFCSSVACEVGVIGAVLYSNIHFWLNSRWRDAIDEHAEKLQLGDFDFNNDLLHAEACRLTPSQEYYLTARQWSDTHRYASHDTVQRALALLQDKDYLVLRKDDCRKPWWRLPASTVKKKETALCVENEFMPGHKQDSETKSAVLKKLAEPRRKTTESDAKSHSLDAKSHSRTPNHTPPPLQEPMPADAKPTLSRRSMKTCLKDKSNEAKSVKTDMRVPSAPRIAFAGAQFVSEDGKLEGRKANRLSGTQASALNGKQTGGSEGQSQPRTSPPAVEVGPAVIDKHCGRQLSSSQRREAPGGRDDEQAQRQPSTAAPAADASDNDQEVSSEHEQRLMWLAGLECDDLGDQDELIANARARANGKEHPSLAGVRISQQAERDSVAENVKVTPQKRVARERRAHFDPVADNLERLYDEFKHAANPQHWAGDEPEFAEGNYPPANVAGPPHRTDVAERAEQADESWHSALSVQRLNDFRELSTCVVMAGLASTFSGLPVGKSLSYTRINRIEAVPRDNPFAVFGFRLIKCNSCQNGRGVTDCLNVLARVNFQRHQPKSSTADALIAVWKTGLLAGSRQIDVIKPVALRSGKKSGITHKICQLC